MGINIEIKAKANEPDRLRRVLENLCASPGEVIFQEDVFFHTLKGKGRLKLRILAPDRGELIYYERDDFVGPKPSNYLIMSCADPNALKILLSTALGIRGVVKKQRLLYRIGNARVHLDDVHGLGFFVEVEVVLHDAQTSEDGKFVAEEIMKKLGVCKTDLIAEAYIDLLKRSATSDQG
jgi:predicted adenylyl cyclase CyaB